MKKAVISVNKPQGWSPLKAILEFKKANHSYMYDTISYAGRLDPMAEGVLLLLVGEENKKRKDYENLKKSYDVRVLFGINTDTFDPLGIVVHKLSQAPKKEFVEATIDAFVGKQMQKFPPYSSKPVKGKALYWWAREGRLSEIEIPQKKIEIYSIKIGEFLSLSVQKLHEEVVERIERVGGDFRQDKVFASWKLFNEAYSSKKVLLLDLQIDCSSGTYIRQIVYDLGERLGCGAIALSIKRTSVGGFTLENCENVS